VLSASFASAGPAGFAFLDIPTGARASALGGAYATLGQGAEAAFWNPAGLEQVKGFQIMGGHYELFQKLRHDHFAVGFRLFGLGMSGSVRALYSEPIEERDELGNLIGSFGSHDLEFAYGVGGKVGAGLSAGVSAQVIRERIANSAAMTYAFGLGGAYDPAAFPNARVAIQVTGLGPSGSYALEGGEGEAVPLPTAVQGGLSYRHGLTSTLALRAALEGRVVRGRNGLGLVGLEVANPAGAAVRLGFRANDDASSFSVGAGYEIKGLTLDYAYVPLKLDLGDTHRFSFAAQF
jgi:hypothetical protein